MGHRLLAVHVLAGRNGIQHHSDMPVVGCCDEHCINVVLLKDLPVVQISLRTLVGSLETQRQIGCVDITDSEFRTWD